jgi:hypothetical protein
MVPAQTSGEQLLEVSLLARHLANRMVNKEQKPDRWQLHFSQIFDGILDYYLNHPGAWS